MSEEKGGSLDTRELDRLRRIVEGTTVAIASFDRAWRFTYLNAEAERLTGRPRTELLGRVVWDAYPDTVDTPLGIRMRRASETNDPDAFVEYCEPLGVWLEVQICVSDDALTCHVRDVSRRMRAEAEARAARDLLGRILEAVPAGVVHVRVDGSIAGATSRAVDLLGISYDQLTRRYVQDFDGETIREDGSAFPADEYPVSRCLGTGDEQPAVTIGVRRPDGTTTWAIFSAVPVRDAASGALEGAVVTFLDITDRVALERRLLHAEKLEAVGRLAGGVAHDFNNLLTVISGYTDFLIGELAIDAGGRVYAEEIRAATERATELTRQLLSFSRRQVLAPRVIEIDRLVGGVGGMLERLIGEDVELVTRLDAGAARVRVDPGQIEQVIANLAVNARDAMPDGGRLTIETRLVDVGPESEGNDGAGMSAGRYVAMNISDTGAGMDEVTASQIFEPFFTTKEQGKGTGLGLATVYGIVKQSGGDVAVASRPGAGTTFTVLLPTVDEALTPDRPTAIPPSRVRATATVLLVEDEEAVRTLAKRSLAGAGYRVLEATNGDEGLERLLAYAGEVDVLVTDVVMPRVGGPELARRVAALRPAIKILFVSGYPKERLSMTETAASGAGFLAKPFTPDRLVAAVEALLSGSSPPTE